MIIEIDIYPFMMLPCYGGLVVPQAACSEEREVLCKP
jgi:hypothetical protein